MVLLIREIRTKYLHVWLGTYLAQYFTRISSTEYPKEGNVHILFCTVDHFEPIAATSTKKQERECMDDWLRRYPLLASRHRDSDGKPPQHTWFYPGENYNSEYLDQLAKMCALGLGEIELHLHHGNDTSDTLRVKIQKAILDFEKHGALVTDEVPARHVYGFIHGNMALDNSMNNPALCGVNNELTILKETGCYADFSMPTAPGISQTKKINSIYYAQDDPDRPKSHDTGIDVEVSHEPDGGLMIVQGPLGINWSTRKYGVIPRVENSEIQCSNPPSIQRIQNWVRQHVHVKGRPEWLIVKVSCHGAEDRSRDVLLGDTSDQMYSYLEQEYRDSPNRHLHYVTARELHNIIKAAEAGHSGSPNLYRNYAIKRYKTHAVTV
jgi:hypothetical protein